MSQHRCATTMNVEVVMGYDRPLDYVYCCVFRNGGETVYCNLDDDNAGTECQDVDYYRPILAAMGITVPESMLEETKADQRLRVGNRDADHTASPGTALTTALPGHFANPLPAAL